MVSEDTKMLAAATVKQTASIEKLVDEVKDLKRSITSLTLILSKLTEKLTVNNNPNK